MLISNASREDIFLEKSHTAVILGSFFPFAISRASSFLIALLPGHPYESANYKWFENRYKSFIYIDRIVISSDHQGKGIGSFFYDHIKLSFHDRLNSMVCEINLIPKNAQSINFHKKYGFTEVGQQYTDQRKKLVSMQLLSF